MTANSGNEVRTQFLPLNKDTHNRHISVYSVMQLCFADFIINTRPHMDTNVGQNYIPLRIRVINFGSILADQPLLVCPRMDGSVVQYYLPWVNNTFNRERI